jgi:hypothetical protein
VPARKSRRPESIWLSLRITKIVSGDVLLRQAARVAGTIFSGSRGVVTSRFGRRAGDRMAGTTGLR